MGPEIPFSGVGIHGRENTSRSFTHGGRCGWHGAAQTVKDRAHQHLFRLGPICLDGDQSTKRGRNMFMS